MPDWDVVYSEKSIADATPCNVLKENECLLQSGGVALDFASGLAGNSVYLSQKGYEVVAWDKSSIAVNKINEYAEAENLNLKAEMHDLENKLPDVKNKFDVVVVSYFLDRENLRYLFHILKKDGILFYQTFSGEQYQGQGPSRSDFRLKKNELLGVFPDMELLFYQEDDCRSDDTRGRQGQVYFVAKK
ncbi:MAG: SAM-dependent methyltransferase [endosymbiont of Galathealinum brachiosum]|uniref:SAM-dependent methyltransferase n=1 Tax=endosymbiont of Galathealinum brachiosum TaxID=2200906 RepID=A0A370DEP6_9GAMM|nr:MAG: SAM-dependent methyltransferase [endosymbiont of Galathealinum brachiosum]